MTAVFDKDVNVTVGIGFGYQPLSTGTVFTDVTTSVRQVTIQRGRTSVLNRFEAGICLVTLDNNDGQFDPGNTASTHAPNILVNTPISVSAVHSGTTYTLFRGVVDAWPPTYQDVGTNSVTMVSAVDDFATLSRILSLSTFSEERTDVRIGTILTNLGWSTTRRDLNDGLSMLQTETVASDENGLTRMQNAADGEAGTLWMSRSGDVTFRNRVKFQGDITPSSTFGPSTGALPYRDIVPAYDNKYLFNDVFVTRSGGVEQQATSTDSVDKHNRISLRKATKQSLDVEAKNTAEWMAGVYGTQRVRVDRLEVRPRSDTGMWPVVLSADFDSTLTVKTDPPGSTGLDQDVVIQGIEHDFSPLAWDTVIHTRSLSTIEIQNFWVLDSSTLDTGTRLA